MKVNFIVIANGQIISPSRLRDSFHKFTGTELNNTKYSVICADGGWLNAKKLNLDIDYLIGDLDSIPSELKNDISAKELTIKEFQNTKVIYDPDQSKTDTRLALELAHQLAAKQVFLLGASGARLDHLLSNILELKYMHDYMDIKLIDEFTEVSYINESSTYLGEIGEVLSVIPLSDIKALHYEGLLFNLNGENIKSGTSLISNKFSAKQARIIFESGELLVMRTYDG